MRRPTRSSAPADPGTGPAVALAGPPRRTPSEEGTRKGWRSVDAWSAPGVELVDSVRVRTIFRGHDPYPREASVLRGKRQAAPEYRSPLRTYRREGTAETAENHCSLRFQ